MADPRVQSAFKVPPEVPRYFAERALKPGFSWLDTWGEEHATAFTVAKAVDLELLTLFRDSIAGAIARGEGFETWRQGLVPELERRGWGGKRLVPDPEGRQPDRAVNFTAPGRLQTIFSANMRSARAAGQWERIQRTKGALPYLLYVRTTSLRPRPQHLSWAGTILPADDPFWRTHFPPNGWRCKCAVRQVSRFEREAKLRDPDYTAERPESVERIFVNRRTGEVVRVPDGIDPGWAHNPGLVAERRRTAADTVSARIEAAAAPPPAPQIPSPVPSAAPPVPRARLAAEVGELVRSQAFARHHADALATGARRLQAEQAAHAAGRPGAASSKAIDAVAPWTGVEMPVAVVPQRLVPHLADAPAVVTASDRTIAETHDVDPVPAADWAKAQAVLDRGEIQVSAAEPRRLWAFARLGGRDWSLVLERAAGAWRTLGFGRRAARAAEDRAVLLGEVEAGD